MNRPRSWLASGILWLLVVWFVAGAWGLVVSLSGGNPTLEQVRLADEVWANGFVIGLAPLAVSIALSVRERLIARAFRRSDLAFGEDAGRKNNQTTKDAGVPEIPWSERWDSSDRSRQGDPVVPAMVEPGSGFWIDMFICLILAFLLANFVALHDVPTKNSIVHVDRQMFLKGRVSTSFYCCYPVVNVQRLSFFGKFYDFSSFHYKNATLDYNLESGDLINKSPGSDILYLNKGGEVSQWRYGGQ